MIFARAYVPSGPLMAAMLPSPISRAAMSRSVKIFRSTAYPSIRLNPPPFPGDETIGTPARLIVSRSL